MAKQGNGGAEQYKVRAENVSKIFGPSPDEALRLIDEGATKDEILEKTGNVVAIGGVDFNVKPGQTFVVMGLSGSGKSTLIRCVNRLIPATSGHIYIDDQDVMALDQEELRQLRLRKMSMVFQHFALFPHKTVAQNVEYGLKVRGVEADERREKALKALDQVGLKAWADNPPSELSGGMQQRVGLARGLAVDPEILLMDEPFSALDPLIRADMQAELLELQREVHKTIIFITHDLNEALILGDLIAIMKDGQFVQIGTAQEIVGGPADDYVSAFTQDVDRSRVFTSGYSSTWVEPLRQDEDSVKTARERLEKEDVEGLHVVDGDGKPVGLVTAEDLAGSKGDGGDLASVMRKEFPKTEESESLAETYDLCTEGLPVAVVDDDGRLTGSLDPLHVFEMLTAGLGKRLSGAEAQATPVGKTVYGAREEQPEDDKQRQA